MMQFDAWVEKIAAPVDDDSVLAWLKGQMGEERPYLLAHTDDGIIWGKWHEQQLVIANYLGNSQSLREIAPPLQALTLQQAFIFGLNSQVHLYHDELENWAARRVQENANADVIPESQLLVGDEVIDCWPEQEFTHLRDKRQQGLDQVLPIKIDETDIANGKRPRLLVHHFVSYDPQSGEARIGLSRLVNVYLGSEEDPA